MPIGSMIERVNESFAASHSQYLRRLADGSQPPPPALVTSTPWLAFLDYRNTEAIVAANLVYLARSAVARDA